jgi:threonine synthase
MSPISVADSILRAIGNTAIVRLGKVVPAGSADVIVKLESLNPTGSYKDRMALAMIEGAEARGALRPGMRVVEFTGGSTGSSLGMVCAAKGYRFVVLSSDAFSREKLLTMEALGAELRLVPSEGGKVTPVLFERFKEKSQCSPVSLTRSGRISSTTKTRFKATWESALNSCSRRAEGSTRSAAPSEPAVCCAACHAHSVTRGAPPASSRSSPRRRRR